VTRFAGKVALITGGGRGIGQAIAERLGAEGAAIAILDVDREAAESAAEALKGVAGATLAVPADITDETGVQNAIGAARARLGPIDVLVNDAACVLQGNLAATTSVDWAAEIQGTLTGAFLVTGSVLPGMLELGRGAIVNVGSVNGLTYLGNPGYSAAKAGLWNYTRALAVEYGPRGVRANMVSPGTVHTDNPSWQKRLARNPRVFEKLARWYPVGRVGRPEDVAAAVAFLAADEAAFVNGANLVVDGGLTAGMPVMIDELTLETEA
jgi:meso-butanediol dehydrogenase/(S,S)-butanediol dehydrogenase/diacetyl reductase